MKCNLLAAIAVAVVGLVAASCGDNRIHTGGGVDSAVTVDGAMCGDGVVSAGEECETGACCVNCRIADRSVECRAATGSCDAAEMCDGVLATCPADEEAPDGTACPQGFCSNGTCGACSINIDADFDGSNQCNDCDDTNGLVKPEASETACEGLDDDCDGKIDENWDTDGDGYSTCSSDPSVFDCNDLLSGVNPGAMESCGPGGIPNAIDENCNGYTDETCTPCTMTDADGDGVTDCQGDCDDNNATVRPGAPEMCDGLDNDCNKFTVKNCDVGGSCNYASEADVCQDDLVCGCILDENGVCNDDYRCVSYCEGSFTGPIGAGCKATETCLYHWLDSDNQHGCAPATSTIGAKTAGETCTDDIQCRSGSCLDYGDGTRRCYDYCDHNGGGNGSCAAGTVCDVVSSTVSPNIYMYAVCGLDNNGAGVTGATCSAASQCKSGQCVGGKCAEPCGLESHCPSGYHCIAPMTAGTFVTTGTWTGIGIGIDGQPSVETVPVCVADGAGTHDRQGGAACTSNGQCASEFCDAALKVCVDMCTTDASCGVNLTCEPVYVKASASAAGIFWGRACVNASFGTLLKRL
jgi:hypothetical protein